MKYIYLIFIFAILSNSANAQLTSGTTSDKNKNAAQNMLSGNFSKGVTIGGYGQIDYNQPLYDNKSGMMDIHRLVLLFGYKFSENVHFITEIELEHVSEVYVEQAFLNYKLNDYISLRGGLMLIPMGYVNEYHEPTQYNGVERPNIDKYIVPTTWREIGAGVTGNIDDISLSYQAYVFNGFNSFNDGGVLRGSDGLRKGRQKGAESLFQRANFSTKVNYYGIQGLKMGLSGYFGETNSTLFDGLDNSNETDIAKADSSIIGVSMVGFDAQYNLKGFEAKTQVIYSGLNNTEKYNAMTGKDLGSSMFGYYLELGYDVLSIFKEDAEQRIVLFGRYEKYDTHNSVADIEMNNAYNRTDITMGVSYHVAQGAVLKADYQLRGDKESNKYNPNLNFGIGIWF
ncbi:MAG: hypothetical protein ABFR62_10205 [Bacteroidota bacterium]